MSCKRSKNVLNAKLLKVNKRIVMKATFLYGLKVSLINLAMR